MPLFTNDYARVNLHVPRLLTRAACYSPQAHVSGNPAHQGLMKWTNNECRS